MRHAEVRRRGRQLARVFEADGRAERLEVDGERGERRHPERRPVEFREESRLHINVY